jgi:hypothetical protein
MDELRAGAQLDRLPGPKYLAQLSFCEVALPSPLPRAATIARWRSELPGPVEAALVAPHPCIVGPRGPLRLEPELVDAMEWLADATAALAARWLVLPTPPEVTPSLRSRERLAAFLDRLREELTDAVRFVWAPAGPWEPEAAAALADRLGVVLAEDPLQAEPVALGRDRYVRLRAEGARPRLSEGLLEDLLDILEGSETRRARVAIASPRSFREASRLQALADERLTAPC